MGEISTLPHPLRKSHRERVAYYWYNAFTEPHVLASTAVGAEESAIRKKRGHLAFVPKSFWSAPK